MLNAVDYVIACYRVNAQPWQVRVDGDIALPGTAVANAVGYAGGYSQFTVTQRRQYGFRDVNGPAQIALYHRGIGVAANRYGHSVARFGIHHFTADGLAIRQLGGVDHIVACNGVDGHARQYRLHIHCV